MFNVMRLMEGRNSFSLTSSPSLYVTKLSGRSSSRTSPVGFPIPFPSPYVTYSIDKAAANELTLSLPTMSEHTYSFPPVL